MYRIGQIGDDLARLGAVAGERFELLQRRAGIAFQHRLHQIEDAGAVGQAEQPTYRVCLDLVAAEGDGAVEDGERVAHRAFRRAGDQRQSRALGLRALGLGDAAKMLDQRLDLDALQVEALAARQHRHRHLARLGGGEDELHMLGRLFQRLEQAGEGRLRQHVHLVEDVDLVAGEVRLVVGAVDQLANIVDAGMRGGIHLDHVEMPALEDGAAMHALLGHVEGRAIDAGRLVVQRTGDQPRGRGLAHAAHAGEHVGLGDAARGERVPERPHHGLLADQLAEGLGPIFAGQRRMALRRRRGAASALPLAGRFALLLVLDIGHGRAELSRERALNTGSGERPRRMITLGARWEAGRATRETLVRAASFRT